MAAIATLRRRALGVAFIGVIAGLLLLSILVYTKFFVTSVDVTLYAGCQPPPAAAGTGTTVPTGTVDVADTMSVADAAAEKALPVCTTAANEQDTNAGHELDVPADVKIRGILVGQVTSITLADDRAVLHLAITPSDARFIPANVSAEIVPKTLFGEKYVDLVIPSDPSSTDIAHGDRRILQSTTSIEAEQVFNDLLPLLQTLQPAQLNITLSNLATALRGRGNELGQTLASTDTYLSGLNPDLGNVEDDITGIEDLANNVNDATPDLLAQARQFSLTARTIVAKSDTFAQFLTGTKGFADTADAILTQNQTNLVQLAKVSQPTLALLAEYSPEYACFLQGLSNQTAALSSAFSPHGDDQYALHINVAVPADALTRHAYTTADTPKNTAQNVETADPVASRQLGAPCFGLPGARTTPIDGYLPINGSPVPGSTTAPATAGSTALSSAASSPAALARSLLAPELGVTGSAVPDLDTVLLSPALAGGDVTASYTTVTTTSGSGR